LNVNTASPEVLAAMIEDLPLGEARAIVVRREHAVFRSFADFAHRLPEGLSVVPDDFSVGSNYFLATMRVTVGESQARGSALLARRSAGWPVVLWRKYP
jgi:general secretion pathway protein K